MEVLPRTPDPDVGGSSPTRVKPCCVLEQGDVKNQSTNVYKCEYTASFMDVKNDNFQMKNIYVEGLESITIK